MYASFSAFRTDTFFCFVFAANAYVFPPNSTTTCSKEFLDLVMVKEVNDIDKCDFILAFCVIVTRVGIDMNAALSKIQGMADTTTLKHVCKVYSLNNFLNYFLHFTDKIKPVIVVVLYRTLEKNFVAPDPLSYVNRENVTTVNCLFNEDDGIIKCSQNNNAIETVKKFKKKTQAKHGCETSL